MGKCATVVLLLCRGADRSLARPTSRCILFDGENISFDASLVICINSTNIPPIMIINRIYEHQNILSLKLVSFLVGLKTYQYRCIEEKNTTTFEHDCWSLPACRIHFRSYICFSIVFVLFYFCEELL